jgi:hypothetical protein
MDVRFLKAGCGPTPWDKQNPSVGCVEPAGYQSVTSGLNSFQKVTGMLLPFAEARIVALVCYFGLVFFFFPPCAAFYNSRGEIPPKYIASTTKGMLRQKKKLHKFPFCCQLTFP